MPAAHRQTDLESAQALRESGIRSLVEDALESLEQLEERIVRLGPRLESAPSSQEGQQGANLLMRNDQDIIGRIGFMSDFA